MIGQPILPVSQFSFGNILTLNPEILLLGTWDVNKGSKVIQSSDVFQTVSEVVKREGWLYIIIYM